MLPEAQAARGTHEGAPGVVAGPDPSANLAWLALALAGIPAFLGLLYLALAPERLEGIHVLVVPLAAFIFPLAAIVLASILLSGRAGHQVDEGARTAAIVALVLGVAVVAAWGIPLLVAMILLASCYQPSPQPCTCTCQGESNQACPACPDPGDGCCGGSGDSGGSGSGGCCGGSGDSNEGSGGSCCGGSGGGSGSGSGGGGGSGSCCGGSGGGSGSGGGGTGGGSGGGPGGGSGGVGGGTVGAPGPGGVAALSAVAVSASLAAAIRRLRPVAPDLAHHPATPAYAQDVFRVRGHLLCVGCFTTFPIFLLAAALLVVVPLDGPWWAWLAAGVGMAGVQGISSAGLARRRWAKVAVKASLGAGLAIAIVAVRASPLPLLAQGLVLLALAAAAFASTVPRRRRMARLAAQ